MTEENLEAAKAITTITREMAEYMAQQAILREKIKKSISGKGDERFDELREIRDKQILEQRKLTADRVKADRQRHMLEQKAAIAQIRKEFQAGVKEAGREGRLEAAQVRREKLGAFDKETAAGLSGFRARLRRAAHS